MSESMPDPASRAGRRPVASPLWWVAAAGISAGVLALAVRYGGGLSPTIVGIPDAGMVTRIGLPSVRLASHAAAAVTVGMLVTAAFLLPGGERTVGPAAYRLLRGSAWAAGAWAVGALLQLVLFVSDLLATPVSRLSARAVASFATSLPTGQALALQALLAGVVAVGARMTLTRYGAATVAVAALVAVLPPAFTGHAAGAGNHQMAVSSMALHALGASLWLGGLVALTLVRPRDLLADVAARFSRLALICWVVVAVSGFANSWIRLGEWEQLWRSSYGILVLAKVIGLAVLGVIGAAYRRMMVPRLRSGSLRAFLRLVSVEVVTVGATLAVAVALSRTPTPVPTDPPAPDRFTSLTGFPMPPPITAVRLVSQPLPDLFFLSVVVVGVGAYLAGVARLRRNGHQWPWSRTLCWTAGMLLLGAMTNLGVARYAYVLFSVHMAEHMVVSMIVPILLVCGAPATLALRALRKGPDPAVRGPREWLLVFLHSRYVRTITHPLVALAIFVVTLYALYFSPLLELLMRNHLGHTFMTVHFVVSGYVLFWTLIGIDPGRRRVPPPLLVLVLLAAAGFHAFFGVGLMQSQTVIASGWFDLVHPPWAPSTLSDQRLGAGIAWAFGEIPSALVLMVLIFRWIQSDEREQRRLDRAADRAEASGEEDELARYNAFLRWANQQADAERRA